MSGKRDLFIGGQWIAAKNKAKFPVYNPSTGEVWAEIADAGRAGQGVAHHHDAVAAALQFAVHGVAERGRPERPAGLEPVRLVGRQVEIALQVRLDPLGRHFVP